MKLTLSTKTAILIALLSFIGSLTYAQSGTPQYIDYQGRLLNSQGGPITSTGGPGTTGTAKNYEIEFRIWKSQSGTSNSDLIFAEKQVVTVTDTGLFSVRIGEGDSIQTGATNTTNIHDAFNGPDRYLGITVDEDNGNPVAEISPRLAFLNVPFAAVAEKAIAVKDGAITSAMIANNTITAGNLAGDSINQSKIQDGAVRVEHIASEAITSDKIASQTIVAGNLANNSINRAKIIDGAVGSDQIENGAVTSAKIANSAVTGAKIANGAVTGAKIVNGTIGISKLGSGVGLFQREGDGDFSYTDGSVGIGVSPDSLLHVSGGIPTYQKLVGTSPNITIETTPSPRSSAALLILENDGNAGLQINSNHNNNASIFFSRDGAAADGKIEYDGGENLEFSTNANVRMKIEKGGDVGIGTTDPNTPLHVDGPQIASENTNTTGGVNFQMSAGIMSVGPGDGKHLLIDGDEIMAINSNFRASDLTLNGRGGTVFFGSGSKSVSVEVLGTLKVNGSSVNTSSRHEKEDFAEVDRQKVLDRLLTLPLSSWKYKGESERRHVGPMSQDFHQAFDELLNLNSDDTTIAPLDEAGVAFASIQALHKIVTEKDEKIEALEERLSRMEAMMKSLSKDDSVNQ